MAKIISPKAEFGNLLAQMKAVAPEVFDSDGQFLNLAEGDWKFAGEPQDFVSPVDGTVLGALPMLDNESALRAVEFAKAAEDDLPALDFASVINARQARELDSLYANALATGATPLFEGKLNDDLFLPNQDRSAYALPEAR